MQMLYWSAVVKRELSMKTKLLVCLSISIPAFIYCDKLWVVTTRIRLQIQAAKMSFLPRVAGLSLTDKVRNSIFRRGLGVELLYTDRRQLRWYHVRSRRRPWIWWRDYISQLTWEQVHVPPDELKEVAGVRGVATQTLFPTKETWRINRWMDKHKFSSD